MKITLVKKGEQSVGTWSGGTTTQLAIWPEGADYASRRFAWRISSAVVELEESNFTPLQGFHRILMILKGEVHLHHLGHRETTLLPFEQDEFEGDWQTKSRGCCTDFNLMTAENWRGTVRALRASPFQKGSLTLSLDGEFEAFYCLQNTLHASVEGGENSQTFSMEKQDFLLIETSDEPCRLTLEASDETFPMGVQVSLRQKEALS